MGIAENKQIVGSFLEGLSTGNPSLIFGALRPDASWWIAPSTPLGGLYQGLDQIMPMMMKNGALFKRGSVRWEVQRMIGEEDFVAVECTMTATTASGKDYFNCFHIQFGLEDGRIKSIREYNDSHYSQVMLFGEAAA